MKHIWVFFFIGCLAIGKNLAQSSTQFTLKAYNTFEIKKMSQTKETASGSDTTVYTSYYNQNTYFHPSIALSWSKNKKGRHELELTQFAWRNIDSASYINNMLVLVNGEKLSLLNIAFRYEYQFLWGKTDQKIKVGLGIGAMPFVSRKYHQRPVTSLGFPYKNFEAGFSGILVPRILFRLSPSFALDLNAPVHFARFAYVQKINENPTLPIRLQRNQYFDFGAYAGVAFRAGIAYTIPQK